MLFAQNSFTKLLRSFSLLAIATVLVSGCEKPIPMSPSSPTSPTIALTFDVHPTAYSTAFPLMKSKGLVGTYFVNPMDLEEGRLTREQLLEMQKSGWSIQAYSGSSMIRFMEENGAAATKNHLIQVRDRMAAYGFSVTALAAGSRAWNSELRGLSKDVYRTVRVARNLDKFQTIPFPDPLFVNDGGTLSLSNDDTFHGLADTLKSLQKTKALWIVIVHIVGDDEDPSSSISIDEFSAFCDLIAAEVKAGRLNSITIQ